MQTYKTLKERLETVNKKGSSAMQIPIALIGLLISVIFVVELLPTIINNLTGMSISGVGGTIVTTILPLIIVFGIFFMIAKSMGLGGMGGKW